MSEDDNSGPVMMAFVLGIVLTIVAVVSFFLADR